MHNFIFFFNPSVIHRFVLAQFGNIAMNETIVIGVVGDLRFSNKPPRCFEAVTGR